MVDPCVAAVRRPCRPRNIRIVLVRPRGAANVGAAARAMKNMGLGRPGAGGAGAAAPARSPSHGGARPRRRARGPGGRRSSPPRSPTATWSSARPAAAARIAPRSRSRRRWRRRSSAHAAARAGGDPLRPRRPRPDQRRSASLPASADDRHAAPEYASLNLAQAVLLVCYELRRAARAGDARGAAAGAGARAGAGGGGRAHVRAPADGAARASAFSTAQNPDHIMFAIRQLFGRTTLADHEVRILLGLARQIDWYARTTTKRRSSQAGHGVAGDGCDASDEPRRRRCAQAIRPATGHRSPATQRPPWLTSSRSPTSCGCGAAPASARLTAACIQILEANLHYALHLFATGSGRGARAACAADPPARRAAGVRDAGWSGCDDDAAVRTSAGTVRHFGPPHTLERPR